MTDSDVRISDGFTGPQWTIIVLLTLTQFTVVLDFMVLSPLGDRLLKALAMRPEQFGLAVSAYAFSAGASGLLAAGFADRFDRKQVLLFFYSGFGVGTLGCALAPTYELLVAARVFTGLFGGVISASSLAIVADLFLLGQRGQVTGYTQMGISGSQLLGVPLSLYLANGLGWHAPFWLLAGLSAGIAALLWHYLPPVTDHLRATTRVPVAAQLGGLLRQRRYALGLLTTALLTVSSFLIIPWNSIFVINNLRVTPQQLPLLFMAAGCCSLVLMPLVGRLSDTHDRFTLFGLATGWLLLVVLLYTRLTAGPFWLVLALNVAFSAGLAARIVPSMALLTALPAPQDRGAFMSLNAALQQLAGGVAAVVSGLIVTQQTKSSPLEHYEIIGYAVAGLSVVSVLLMRQVSQHAKSDAAGEALPLSTVNELLTQGGHEF